MAPPFLLEKFLQMQHSNKCGLLYILMSKYIAPPLSRHLNESKLQLINETGSWIFEQLFIIFYLKSILDHVTSILQEND